MENVRGSRGSSGLPDRFQALLRKTLADRVRTRKGGHSRQCAAYRRASRRLDRDPDRNLCVEKSGHRRGGGAVKACAATLAAIRRAGLIPQGEGKRPSNRPRTGDSNRAIDALRARTSERGQKSGRNRPNSLEKPLESPFEYGQIRNSGITWFQAYLIYRCLGRVMDNGADRKRKAILGRIDGTESPDESSQGGWTPIPIPPPTSRPASSNEPTERFARDSEKTSKRKIEKEARAAGSPTVFFDLLHEIHRPPLAKEPPYRAHPRPKTHADPSGAPLTGFDEWPLSTT